MSWVQDGKLGLIKPNVGSAKKKIPKYSYVLKGPRAVEVWQERAAEAWIRGYLQIAQLLDQCVGNFVYLEGRLKIP